MTLNLTVTIAVIISDPETTALEEKDRLAYAQNACQVASDRVANWFRGHPSKISTTGSLDVATSQS